MPINRCNGCDNLGGNKICRHCGSTTFTRIVDHTIQHPRMDKRVKRAITHALHNPGAPQAQPEPKVRYSRLYRIARRLKLAGAA